jgi:rhamnulose-1-phosphate aldolase/alcohol dehydrogenase
MNAPVTGLAGAAMPPFAEPVDAWDAGHAATLTAEQQLLYRSNLLGADLTITNFGGGNTSAKLPGTDPLTGEIVDVLWVKGSGGDLGSMALDGFATLYLQRLRGLERRYEGVAYEDTMVPLLAHCTFGLNPRAASIDTPLHGFLPQAHVDHLHPDAVIALAAAADGEAAVAELWQGDVGWLPWQRPGFDLGLKLREHVATHPRQRGVVMAGHGLICWGDSSEDCYRNSVGLIADAARFLNARTAGRPAFGGPAVAPLPPAERRAGLRRLLPRLRRLMGHKLADVRDDPATLAFVGGSDMPRLAGLGTSCPDHFLRTKIRPLVLDPAALADDAALAAAVEGYREDYAASYRRCAGPDDPPMRDPNPIIVLVPGVGRLAFAANRTTARLAAEFYGNAINVMHGAEVLGGYLGLDEREAFAIEYWALEEAKLKRLPPPPPLEGRIAMVTGSAGGIGAATARRLLAEGACVMLTDRDDETLAGTAADLIARHGRDRVAHAVCDVTDENAVAAATDACVLAFGGLDMLVANAGLASAGTVEETTLDVWRRNYDVLAEGVFLCARAAFPLLRAQGGGAIVIIGSKNALAATPGASAYASAKAAALHLARCLALEGAPFGIRVNSVNPDAVIRGSGIWDGAWRRERAGAHGVDPGEELEAHYRNRSLLKCDVLPEDVAEAVLFLASDRAAKSTGNIINVDAGNAQAFPR